MSTHEDRRPIDRHTAELLLGGLLAAASAPGAVRELAGEDAAATAFVAAGRPAPSRPRRIDMLKAALAKMVTVKVIATCVALCGAGGVAFAAGTGTLPVPLHKPVAHPSATASHSARPFAGAPAGERSARPSPSPSPADLWGLCERWSARPGKEREHALDEPEFGDLVEQAGKQDRQRVDHFCSDLRKAGPGGKALGAARARPARAPAAPPAWPADPQPPGPVIACVPGAPPPRDARPP